MQIQVWAILGESNAGKSTMIGHLTSMFGKGENGIDPNNQKEARTVLLRGGGYLNIWAKRQALQEAQKSPDEFIQEIRSKANAVKKNLGILPQYFNILIALRHHPAKNLPDGLKYLSCFNDQPDFQIHSLVCLPPRGGDASDQSALHHKYLGFGVPTCIIRSPVFTDEPIAHQVGQIRNHFGWA